MCFRLVHKKTNSYLILLTSWVHPDKLIGDYSTIPWQCITFCALHLITVQSVFSLRLLNLIHLKCR